MPRSGRPGPATGWGDWESVTGLGVGPEGRLWVVRGTEHAPVFDVFDMTGTHLFSARLDRPGRSWNVTVGSGGILAWEDDPLAGYQRIYIIEMPER